IGAAKAAGKTENPGRIGAAEPATEPGICGAEGAPGAEPGCEPEDYRRTGAGAADLLQPAAEPAPGGCGAEMRMDTRGRDGLQVSAAEERHTLLCPLPDETRKVGKTVASGADGRERDPTGGDAGATGAD